MNSSVIPILTLFFYSVIIIMEVNSIKIVCSKCNEEIIDPIYNALVIGYDEIKNANIIVCPECYYKIIGMEVKA